MIINQYIKRFVIYTLLYVYCFGLIKPIMPIVNDIIAHTFYKMEHLATVHFENGKYHVHAELANEADQQKNQKGNFSENETLASHLISNKTEFIFYNSISPVIFFQKEQHLPDAFVQNTSPPPEV